ncbi:dsRBD fold-containing protein [Mycobacterium sp. Marseille-P9652]|uniref:dsRBD fold-containing protein n=1 Tax=Mycobacterium sp. Marseille-P9652 TaxID=2654950 RepID=UPI0018D1EBE1|nr:dsRBD fold-containing protein [Mycobacterium sp. Marseille-P9652]
MHQNTRTIPFARPRVTVAIDERDGRTYATAELRWSGEHVAGTGVAYQHPSDCLTRRTGQERATARALSDLAGRLTALGRINA